jgi:hypothetical protein
MMRWTTRRVSHTGQSDSTAVECNAGCSVSNRGIDALLALMRGSKFGARHCPQLSHKEALSCQNECEPVHIAASF